MSDIAVTFLRTNPAYPCFPGQTVDVEIAAACVLIAEGFAVQAEPAIPPFAEPDTYASPEINSYEQAVMPPPAPTMPPTDIEFIPATY